MGDTVQSVNVRGSQEKVKASVGRQRVSQVNGKGAQSDGGEDSWQLLRVAGRRGVQSSWVSPPGCLCVHSGSVCVCVTKKAQFSSA